MPMRIVHERDDRAHLIVVTLTGDISADDIHALIEQQVSNGAWAYDTLYDQRTAHIALSPTEIRAVAAQVHDLIGRHGPRGRVAVAVGADVDFGMNRLWSAYAESAGYEIGVFRTLEDARVWLREG